MLDIHTHILPGVDDGAADLTDAILMAELAAEGGTGVLVATPHDSLFAEGTRKDPKSRIADIKKIKESFAAELEKRGIGVTVLLGMEILAGEDVARRILENEVLPMPGGKAYLLEFWPDAPAEEITSQIRSVTALGKQVIFAHPERCLCIQNDPGLARHFAGLGCRLQINKENVLGLAGRREEAAARRMLKEELVSYVASDAHDPYLRTPHLGEVRTALAKTCSGEYIRHLLSEDAETLEIR